MSSGLSESKIISQHDPSARLPAEMAEQLVYDKPLNPGIHWVETNDQNSLQVAIESIIEDPDWKVKTITRLADLDNPICNHNLDSRNLLILSSLSPELTSQLLDRINNDVSSLTIPIMIITNDSPIVTNNRIVQHFIITFYRFYFVVEYIIPNIYSNKIVLPRLSHRSTQQQPLSKYF